MKVYLYAVVLAKGSVASRRGPASRGPNHVSSFPQYLILRQLSVPWATKFCGLLISRLELVDDSDMNEWLERHRKARLHNASYR